MWNQNWRIGERKRFEIVLRKSFGAQPRRFELLMTSCSHCVDLEYVDPEGSVSIQEPAKSPNAMTVGAVHHSPGRCGRLCTGGSLLWYSSQGPTTDGRTKPDIAAPTHVSTVSYGRWTGEGQSQNWGFTGTSAAQPHVAGAAALVKQAFPDYGPDQIQRFLEDRSEDLGRSGKDNLYGAGLLQLGQPPTLQPPRAPTDLQAQALSPTEVELTWQDQSEDEQGFRVLRDDQETATLPPDTERYLDRNLQSNTRYCYRVEAFNEAGEATSGESCVTTLQENRPPVALITVPQTTVVVGETVRLDGSSSSDPDGDPLSFRWRFLSRPPDSEAELADLRAAQTSFVPDVPGVFELELAVEDGRGGHDADETRITAVPSFTYEGRFTAGELGRLELPPEIQQQLPVGASFVERPQTTRRGQTSDRLEDAGLQLSPSTGTIFGTPAQTGSFRFLIDVLDNTGTWAAELWAQITIEEAAEPVPQLEVLPDPPDLDFGELNRGQQATLVLTIRNAGGGVLDWEVSVEAPWVTASPARGQLEADGVQLVQVTVNTGALAPGPHTTPLAVTASGIQQEKRGTIRVVVVEQPVTGQLLAVKFEKLEFLRPQDWERSLQDGCVVYTNVSSGATPLRVTLPGDKVETFDIPAGNRVIVCGDVAHIDTRK